MSFEFFSQILIIPLTLIAGFLVFKKYIERGGLYLYIFTICLAIWCFLYSLIFSTSLSPETLLLMTKIMYATSLVGVYSMLIFYFFFIDLGFAKKMRKGSRIYLICALLVFTLVLKTPYVIESYVYSPSEGEYREVFGILYGYFHYLYIIASILVIILIFLTSRFCSNQIDRSRAIVIGIGFFLSFTSCVIILVVLPLYNVIFLEKQAILFMLPFIVSVFYSLNNYIFFSFQKKLVETLIFIFSFSISYTLYFILKEIYIYSFFGLHGSNFWGLSSDLGLFDILAEILLFLLVKKYLSKQAHLFIQDFGDLIESIKNKIFYTTSFEELSYIIEKSFKEGIGIKNVTLQIKTQNSNTEELGKYFSEQREHNLIINDKVFIGESLTVCSKDKLTKEVAKLGYLIFPLYRDSIFVGVISFGKRELGNNYSKEEVEILGNFSKFLQGHLKYLDIYSEIHDLNLNLEKRVDEKTIELNSTISKQKEFIEVVSHEIRTPLATALFQAEALEGELMELKIEKKRKVIDEVRTLYSKITDTVNLVNRLFTIEKFEANKIQLYTTPTDLSLFLKQHIQSFEKAYKKIVFEYDKIENVEKVEIDVVQFNQVLDNIISNAIKFTSQVQNPKISVTLVKKKNEIIFTIEDSGIGFSGVDISRLFDKYSTGKSSSIGLGMGLYLCKKNCGTSRREYFSFKVKESWVSLF